MPTTFTRPALTRRELLRQTTRFAGAAIAVAAWPRTVANLVAGPLDALQQAATDSAAAMRQQMGAIPIATTPLGDKLTMLSGPGGNVVVLNGPDGKVVVDTFVRSVWDKLKPLLDGMGSAPIKAAIDTHWHLDHSDGNENFRAAGAELMSIRDLYDQFASEYYPMLFCACLILPLFMIDFVRLTHRIAGPLVRFRIALVQLMQGHRVNEVELRKGDLLTEFQQAFNEFLSFYNRQIDGHRYRLIGEAGAHRRGDLARPQRLVGLQEHEEADEQQRQVGERRQPDRARGRLVEKGVVPGKNLGLHAANSRIWRGTAGSTWASAASGSASRARS